MKILQVVHSFLPHTKAGAEVYSYVLSKELSKRHEVFVFFRVNRPQEREHSLIHSRFEGLETYAINNTFRLCHSFEGTYNNVVIDREFGILLDRIKPDIVHIHHLLFLSHGIINEIKKRDIPIIFTLHDYWLICYRGQLIKDDLAVCKGNSVAECRDCLKYLLRIKKYSLYSYRILRRKLPSSILALLKRFYLLTGKSNPLKEVEKRKDSIEDICSKIDLFIAPSHFIKNKFIEHGFIKEKILYCPHGFDFRNYTYVSKNESKILRFAYMGTLLPMKGVDILISAFKGLKTENVELSIYGKLFSYSGFESYHKILEKMIRADSRIKLKGEYANKDIGKILSDVDVLVAPSIWQENAPLVIQEAFLSKTPVIASRIGGIPELVKDGVNGLLFTPGDVKDLQAKLEYVINNLGAVEKFKENMPVIKSIEDDAKEMEEIYSRLTAEYKS